MPADVNVTEKVARAEAERRSREQPGPYNTPRELDAFVAGAMWRRAQTPDVGCHDCGRPYGDEHGFPDLVIPHDAWARISPTGDEGGLLCPSCICKRLHDAGITTEGRFTSGPLLGAGGHHWALLTAEKVAGIAEVLREHEGQGETCWGCGASREPSPGAPWAGWHAAHQTAAVVEWLRGRAL